MPSRRRNSKKRKHHQLNGGPPHKKQRTSHSHPQHPITIPYPSSNHNHSHRHNSNHSTQSSNTNNTNSHNPSCSPSSHSHTSHINDLHHTQRKHGDNIYEIMNLALNDLGFSRCNLDTCDFANRHYRTYGKNKENMGSKMSDAKVNLYCDTMDSFHYYLFHPIWTIRF